MQLKSMIMNSNEIERALRRMALEIMEKNKGANDVCLVGIKRRGVPMAHYISNFLRDNEHVNIPVGSLDITLYRDDLTMLAEKPLFKGSQIGFEVKDKHIILVDDVLYTGRTVRAAIDGVLDHGRPKSIQLCVLIDRGHHEMPVVADFVGKFVPTSKSEVIKVNFYSTDEIENVSIME
jgi:pyrimidine operon attenuation protein/uracil phosphoribosyltransferase